MFWCYRNLSVIVVVSEHKVVSDQGGLEVNHDDPDCEVGQQPHCQQDHTAHHRPQANKDGKLMKLVSSHTVSKIILRITDLKRTKMVSRRI